MRTKSQLKFSCCSSSSDLFVHCWLAGANFGFDCRAWNLARRIDWNNLRFWRTTRRPSWRFWLLRIRHHLNSRCHSTRRIEYESRMNGKKKHFREYSILTLSTLQTLNHPHTSCGAGDPQNYCITDLSSYQLGRGIVDGPYDYKFYLSFNNFKVDSSKFFHRNDYPEYHHFMSKSRRFMLSFFSYLSSRSFGQSLC